MTTERFFTSEIASSERLAYWNQIGCETYGEIVVQPRSDVAFNCVLLRRAYGDVLLSQVTSTPAVVQGRPWSVSPHDAKYCSVMLQDAGASECVVDGRPLRHTAGTVSMTTESQPYSIACDDRSRFLTVRLPLPLLAARIGDPQRLSGRRVEARDAALLAGFLRTLMAHDEPAHEPGWHHTVNTVLVDLIALAYHRIPLAPARSGGSERWWRTMREFVDHHLDDPELGSTMIAHHMGVTPRYVQKVFAGMATTASAHILEQRLERVAQLLMSGSTRIIDVALRAGFNDLSYFYRSFHKRFGVSPRRFAAARRCPGPKPSN